MFNYTRTIMVIFFLIKFTTNNVNSHYTEIVFTTKCPDIVILSVKAKNVFVIESTALFEENFDWAQKCKLENYDDLQERCVRNGWIKMYFLSKSDAEVSLPTQPPFLD